MASSGRTQRPFPGGAKAALRFKRLLALAACLALFAVTPRARADDARDLLETVPAIALLEGSWSTSLQLATLLSSRRWDAPQPRGIAAQLATRALYGSTWTAMLVLESWALSLAHGGGFDWLAEARFRSDWALAATLPACPRPVAYGGCGIGAGGFGTLAFRTRGSSVWLEAGGGWLEQRVSNDERRTLSESFWVLSPLGASVRVESGSGPLAAEARVGVAAYFGMHSAHLHPTRSTSAELDGPWHELRPIDWGAGPGTRVALALRFARRLRLEWEGTVAPLLAGSRRSELGAVYAPLDGRRAGIPTFRSFSAGASIEDAELLPFRFGLALFRGELSTRRIDRIGHGGVFLRFEYPLLVPTHVPAQQRER